jgi:hypothetical protein
MIFCKYGCWGYWNNENQWEPNTFGYCHRSKITKARLIKSGVWKEGHIYISMPFNLFHCCTTFISSFQSTLDSSMTLKALKLSWWILVCGWRAIRKLCTFLIFQIFASVCLFVILSIQGNLNPLSTQNAQS